MFDWITWSVWLVGLIILVVWILVPLREFGEVRARMRARQQARAAEKSDAAARRETD